jgi:signal transduction histidine kinase
VAGVGFRVRLSLPETLPVVAVPESSLEAVLTAVLENARQAGAAEAEIAANADGAAVTLAVQDNGPGIPEADRERLFEPFFTSKRDIGGTGLGLSIARSLLSAHHGAIGLAPSARGARFELTLPLSAPA